MPVSKELISQIDDAEKQGYPHEDIFAAIKNNPKYADVTVQIDDAAKQGYPSNDIIRSIRSSPSLETVYNPLGGIADVGKLLYDIPVQVKGAVANLIEEEDPYAKTDWKDSWREAAKKRTEQRISELGDKGTQNVVPYITRKDIAEASGSTGFSLASMGAGALGAGAGFLTPVPGGATAGMLAGSGAAAYKMDKAAFTADLLKSTENALGRPMTDLERKALLDKTDTVRTKHALWEAGPEAVGNLLTATGVGNIFKGVGKNIVKKIVTGLAEIYGGELTTETVTQTGQQRAEVEAGLSDEAPRSFLSPSDTLQSFKEVAPQTMIISSLAGGGGAVAGKVFPSKKEVAPTPPPGPLTSSLEKAGQLLTDLGIAPSPQAAAPSPLSIVPEEIKPVEALPQAVAKAAAASKVEALKPEDRLNSITRTQAGEMVANGDTEVLHHIAEGVLEKGRPQVEDAIKNEALGNIVKAPKGTAREEVKKNIVSLEGEINHALSRPEDFVKDVIPGAEEAEVKGVLAGQGPSVTATAPNLPTDIVTKSGTPYPSEENATKSMKFAKLDVKGYAPVQVEGGWVLRKADHIADAGKMVVALKAETVTPPVESARVVLSPLESILVKEAKDNKTYDDFEETLVKHGEYPNAVKSLGDVTNLKKFFADTKAGVAPSVAKVEKIPVVKAVLQLKSSHRATLEAVKSEIAQGEAGERINITDAEGNVTGKTARRSSFPDYFKDKGYTKAEAIAAVNKALTGEKLTINQRFLVEDLNQGYRESRARGLAGERTTSEVEAAILEVGDSFKRHGEQFHVEAVNEDGKVKLKDGVEFYLQGDEALKYDRGTLKRAEAPTKSTEKEAPIKDKDQEMFAGVNKVPMAGLKTEKTQAEDLLAGFKKPEEDKQAGLFEGKKVVEDKEKVTKVVGKGITPPNDYTRDTMLKIGRYAPVEFTDNPAFISFKTISAAQANSAVKRLRDYGYDAERFENYVRVNKATVKESLTVEKETVRSEEPGVIEDLTQADALKSNVVTLQEARDGMPFTTKKVSNVMQGPALLDAIDYLVKIKIKPESTTNAPYAIKGQPSSGESGLQNMLGNVKSLRNIIGGDAFLEHGFGGLNIETQGLVLDHVDSLSKDNQILNTVIKFIPINMVDNLSRQKLTPNMILHDTAMTESAVSGKSSLDVTSSRNVSDTFIRAFALSGAIKQSGLAISDLIRPPKKGGTTDTTFDLDHAITSMFDRYNNTRYGRQKQEKKGMKATETSKGISLGSGFGALQDSYEALERITKEKIKDAIPHLENIGNSVYKADMKFTEFTKSMKAALGNLWEKFSSQMIRVFQSVKAKVKEERGSFSTKPLEEAKPFYSQLERTIESKIQSAPDKKVDPDTFKGLLSTTGIKPDELTNTKIKDFLEGKKAVNEKVSKNDVLDYLKEQRTEMKDVVLGGGRKARDLDDIAQEMYNRDANELNVEQRIAVADEQSKRLLPDTHFSQYQLPGGTNYREMFVTAPEKPSLTIEETPEGFVIREKDGAFLDMLPTYKEAEKKRNEYMEFPDELSAAWQDGHPQYADIANPVIRIRFNERTDDAGRKLIFIEEVQGPSKENQAKMPEWLRKRQYDIGVKRILKYAADNGFAGVSWTPGNVQIGRYDLSKQIDHIVYWKMSDGQYGFSAYKNAADAAPIMKENNLSPSEIEQFIGKDITQKIVDGVNPTTKSGDTQYGELSGLDLKVGGEGLNSLYDTILPKKFQEITKGKVGETRIKTPVPGFPEFTKDKGLDVPFIPVPKEAIEGFALYSNPMFDPALIYKELKGLTNSIKEAMPHLERLGQRVYSEGADTYQKFAAQMKTHLKELWETFGRYMMKVFQSAKKFNEALGERGSFSWKKLGGKSAAAPEAMEGSKLASKIEADRASGDFATDEELKAEGYTDTEEEAYLKLTEEDDNIDMSNHLLTKDRKEIWDDAKKTVDRTLGIISTRLGNINLKIMDMFREHQFDLSKAIARDHVAARPFIEKFQKLPKNIRIALSNALLDGRFEDADIIAKRHGLIEETKAAREIFDTTRTRAIEAGLEVGKVDNYWARVVKNPKRLMAAIRGTEAWSGIDAAIKRIEKEGKGPLSEVERGIVIDQILRGYPANTISLTSTSHLKERKFKTIPKEYLEYYMPADQSLLSYITSMNNTIEAAKFFGKSKKPRYKEFIQGVRKEAGEAAREENRRTGKMSRADYWDAYNKYVSNAIKEAKLEADINPEIVTESGLDESIGGLVNDLMRKGLLDPNKEQDVRDMAQAVFRPARTGYGVRAYKNLTYLQLLTQFTPAITQIQDIALSAEKAGYWNTLKVVGNVISGNADFTVKDVHVENIMTEIDEGQDKLAKALQWALSKTGFTWMDRIGKETLLNASMLKFQKQAQSNDPKLRARVERIFEDHNPEQVMKDLAAGVKNDDTLFMLFNELSDQQPITVLEVPEKYLTAKGVGKTFYALKTFQLKLFDVYRRDVWNEYKNGNKTEASRKLFFLTTALILMGIGTDEIKDFLLGRAADWDDRAIDNGLKLVGFSKYTIYKVRKEGLGQGLLAQFAPPLGIVDPLSKDIDEFIRKGELEKGARSAANVPIAGKMYYWWLGRGAEQKAEDAEKRQKEERIRKRLGEVGFKRYKEREEKKALITKLKSERTRALKRADTSEGKRIIISKYREKLIEARGQ